jgi:eukaryotic-like serine/threonine-protein kinase
MPQDLQRARELFLHAVGHVPPAQWDAYVAEACGADEALRQQVAHLLQVHREAGSFLEQPAEGLAATSAFQGETAGTVIGPYKLVELIGEGGMGTVWMAQQTEPVKRLVALKLIKAGMDSKQVLARFEAERQALALMDHPNIARVLDAGTTAAGRPYFVMELVKGIPITRYCDEHRLTPQERLDLFVPVCQAVQHAHQKGIIHRDLKPSNVLIARYDGRPVPKVIDFGVAKAAGQQLTEHTLVTGFGAVIGTLEYMSPEQAELNQLDIDTRSDIYALGVLLYELLTGTTPLDKKRLKDAAIHEALRLIREEEPPRPSTRLSTTASQPSIAANRGLEPKRLRGLVRGELDWIVMKALEKDRNRRYETANGFAMDVQRYLADEPVLACPPSVVYRFRKFVRRNKGPVVAVLLLLLALTAGIVGTTWGMLRATAAETVAHTQAEAEKIARQDADRASKEAVTNMLIARQIVDQLQTRVAEKLADTPQMELVRQELLEDALKFYQVFLGQKSTDPALRLETGKALNRVGFIYYYMGRRTDAVRALRESVAVLEALVAEYPSEPGYRAALVESCITFGDEVITYNDRPQEAEPLLRRALGLVDGGQPEDGGRLARVLHCLGVAQWYSGRFGEAEATIRRSLAAAEQFSQRFPTDSESRETQAHTLEHFGDILARTDVAEAERVYRQALDIRKKLLAKAPTRQANRFTISWDQQRLAWLLQANGRLAEAEELYRQSIVGCEKVVADFPTRLNYRSALGYWHLQLGTLLEATNRAAEAEQAYRQAWAVSTEKVAAKVEPVPIWFDRLIRIEGRLVSLLATAGRKQDVEAHYRQALSFWEKLAAQSSGMFSYHAELMRMRTYRLLADCLMANGREDEANELLRQASNRLEEMVQSQRTEFILHDDKTRRNLDALANCYAALGRHAEALRIREQMLKVCQEGQPKDGKGVEGWLLNQLAWFLATSPDPKFRDPRRAVRLAQLATSHAPPPNMTVGAYWYTLGVAHYRAGNWKQSLEALEKGLKLQQSAAAWDWFFHAMAHWQLGNRDEARRYYALADYAMGMFGPTYQNEELRRFRAEAAELLGLNEKK